MNSLALGSQFKDYTLLEKIGEGASGQVFKARRGSQLFAVKILTEMKGAGIDAVQRDIRFRNETSQIARLSHPNLSRIFEFGEFQNQRFIIMELLTGEDLRVRLQMGALPYEDVRQIAIALAQACKELHGNGLIHRDLKPENVILNTDGSLKLIDFGLGGDIEEINITSNRNETVGTYFYSSPEQLRILKRKVDGRSDLYSLGILLYECLTGKRPFESSDLAELLQMHAQVRPAPLACADIGCPLVFGQIIEKLLAKDPDDRYQSAASLLFDLENLSSLESERKNRGAVEIGKQDAAGSAHSRLPLMGRQQELASLQQAIQSLQQKRGSFQIIEGEGGAGKSRLVKEAVQLARAQNLLVLTAKCTLQAQDTPLGLISQLIDDYCASVLTLQPDQQQKELKLVRAAASESLESVARLSRGFQKLFGNERVSEFETDPQRFLMNVVSFFVQLARTKSGLVLLMDDIQWMDSMSRHAVISLAKGLESEPICVLSTSRNDSASIEGLRLLKSRLDSLASSIEVGPLDISAIQEIVVSYLGNHPAEPVIGHKALAFSNGNPFVAIEYLSTLVAKGCLRLDHEKWVLDEHQLRQVDFSGNVYSLVLDRIQNLSEATKAMMQIAAVIGFSFDTDLLQKLSKFSISEIRDHLRAAVSANVIEALHENRFQFVHDRVREALTSSFAESEIRDLNTRIANLLYESIDFKSSQVYELAAYFKRGNSQAHPQHVFNTNLSAARLAHGSYLPAQAFDFFSEAKKWIGEIQLSGAERTEFWRDFGSACIDSGQLSEAHQNLQEALRLCEDPVENAAIHCLLGRAYSVGGQFVESWEAGVRACAHLGLAYPRGLGSQILFVLKHIASNITPLSHILQVKQRARLRLIASNFEYMARNAYLLGQSVDTVCCALGSYTYGKMLGPSRELIRGHCGMAALFGLLLLRRPAMKHLQKAADIADQLHDEAMKTYIQGYKVFATEFLGDAVEAEKLAVSVLPDLRKRSGIFEFNYNLVFLINQYSIRGYVNESNEQIHQFLPLQEEYKSTSTIFFLKSTLYFHLIMMDRVKEASGLVDHLHSLSAELGDKVKVVAYRVPALHFIAMYEQRDFSPAIDEQIEKFYSYKFDDYFCRIFYIWAVYIRLAQIERATTPGDRQLRQSQAKLAIRRLGLTALTPVYRSHYFICKGAFRRLQGHSQSAEKYLRRGLAEAQKCHSVFGLFMAHQELAKLVKDQGDVSASELHARQARDLAQQHGWKLRAKNIEQEFALQPFDSDGRIRSNRELTKQVDLNSRIVDALLRVNLASGLMLDANQQVQSSLDEIIRIFAADRAFVFMAQEGPTLRFQGGRNGAGESLDEPKGYSSTVIARVQELKEAVVVAGSDEMQALGSESAVAHGLRSIMAIPLMLRGEFKGVVYVDSAIAKGLFNKDDVQVFKAIANQIAVAFENLKMMAIETAKKAAEKDLEITANVQKMLLPTTSLFHAPGLKLSGFYRPAAQCGGDWWWYKMKSPDKFWLFVGDVTGHGAGPAMISSSIAACFEFALQTNEAWQLPEIMREASRTLFNLAKGDIQMSALGLEVDLKERVVRSWNAGSPGFFMQDESGELDQICNPGTWMGSENFGITEASYRFQQGQRLIVVTDGLLELQVKEQRQISRRQLLSLFKHSRQNDIEKVIAFLVTEIDRVRGQCQQGDDITMAVLELRDPCGPPD
jgi:serine/threonine protein kinase/serine phosphatase RsbU (regulator of sigma subunit)/tetratricopeptide (TPR) repeat protein